MTPVTSKVLGKNGKVLTKVDLAGAVFAPIPGKASRPVYSFGPKGQATRPVMFTCPVSAIADGVFDLMALWQDCRLMKTLPLAGGWLDQPTGVRTAFPVFESEYQTLERNRAGNPQETAAIAAAMTLKAAFGAKK